MEYLRGTLFLSVASIVCCENFISVLTSCRYWDLLDTYSNAGDQRFHCILDQDKVPGIVYTEWTTIPSGNCPIYNRHAEEIDFRPCNSSIGNCPSVLIRSYQAVVYTGCFQMPLARKPSLVDTEKSTDAPDSDKKDRYSIVEKLEETRAINIAVMVLTIPVTYVTIGFAIGYCYKRCKRRQIPTVISENSVNTATSRSSSVSNSDATRCDLHVKPLLTENNESIADLAV